MKLIDSHCHIHSIEASDAEPQTVKLWQKMAKKADTVIKDARLAGVEKLICVGCSLKDSKLAVNFVKNRANLFAAIGIHPHEAKNHLGSTFRSELSSLVHNDKVVAIGECGLDYYYLHSSKDDQISLLEMQLDLASKANLAVIFHVRQAFDDFWPIFDNFKPKKAVLHSYTDDLNNLDKALTRGLFIGVNGIVTFNRDPILEAVYQRIPLTNLVLETDSPFLTPKPYRGTVNEPKRLSIVCDYLADFRHIDRQLLVDCTTKNARNLFGF